MKDKTVQVTGHWNNPMTKRQNELHIKKSWTLLRTGRMKRKLSHVASLGSCNTLGKNKEKQDILVWELGEPYMPLHWEYKES